jgi:hypothetical protein
MEMMVRDENVKMANLILLLFEEKFKKNVI